MNLSVKDWVFLGVAILAVLFLGAALKGWSEYFEWQDRVERMQGARDSAQEAREEWQDSALVLEERLVRTDSAAERARSALQNVQERADSALRLLHEMEVAAEIEADSLQGLLIQQIRADLAPEVLESTAQRAFSAQQRHVMALRGQITEKNRVIGSQDAVITRQDRQITERDTLLAVKDSIITHQAGEIELRDDQIAELEEESKPGLFQLPIPDFARDLLLVGVGYAGSKLTS